MARFRNKTKARFLDSLPTDDIENSDLASRSGFCFSFLDTAQVGQEFSDWNNAGGATSLDSVLNKMKDYTRQPLTHWTTTTNAPLVIYGQFPNNSDFFHPKHVPHDVLWGRFRLGNKVRLVGFIISDGLDGKVINLNGQDYRLSCNIFYVVFLDKDHKFYKTEAS